MANLPEFLSRLQKVRKTGKNSWVACCSGHGDKNPSMTVSEGSDGRILVHCFSHGCGIDEIAAGVGMDVKDLMPENLGYHRIKPLAMAVNPRDALHAIREDMQELLVTANMVKRKEEIDTLRLAKIINRLDMTIALTGGL